MLYAPDDLVRKNQTLLASWEHYQAAPSMENFVELAVSINSYTEFLIDKGVTALHHASHQLEQTVLALFNTDVVHPLPEADMADLDQRIRRLSDLLEIQRVAEHDVAERRGQVMTSLPMPRQSNIWLIGHDPGRWEALLAQLAHFGMQVNFLRWSDTLPERMDTAPILLLDFSSLTAEEAEARIRMFREQCAIGQLIGLGVPSNFDQLQSALRGGCDACLLVDMPTHEIVASILELNERHEQEAFRVLIVEDSKTASAVIQRTLEENQMLSQAIHDPRQVLDALRTFNPDLILMDMYMPGCTGVEAARVIRQHDAYLSIPIVYLSGETDVALQVDAMRLGGDHFLTKPFNPVFLNAIIKSKIERYRALRRSMYHDSLTGLLNHTSGKNMLDTLLAGLSTGSGMLSVVMLDIDHFKKINDSYGHPVGDQVIRNLSWLLKQRLRKQDLLCRYGGEEFLIALPNTQAEQAYSIIERIRQDFGQIRHSHGQAYFMNTASGGIASYPSFQTSDALVKAADDALYEAKRGGRDRLVIAKC